MPIWPSSSVGRVFQPRRGQHRFGSGRYVHHDYLRTTSVSNLINILGWDHLHNRNMFSPLSMFHEIRYHLVNIHIPQIISPATFIGTHNNRLKYTINSSKCLSFYPRSIRLCDQLPSTAVFCGFTCSIPSSCFTGRCWDEFTNCFQDAAINQHYFYLSFCGLIFF